MVEKVDVEQVGKGESRSLELDGETRIKDLLDNIGKNSEEVVVKRNEKIVSKEEKVEEGDNIMVIPIVSGG